MAAAVDGLPLSRHVRVALRGGKAAMYQSRIITEFYFG
jgi:hypothetical protein